MSFIKFEENGTSPSGKTKRWNVFPTAEDGILLGTVHWYAPWRKYVYESERSIYDEGCLEDIKEFITTQTVMHRAKHDATPEPENK